MEKGPRGGVAAIAVFLILLPGVRGDDFGPWSVDNRHPTYAKASVGRPSYGSANPFSLAFQVWSQLLTRIDGPRCAHRPSCSLYAHQALRRYGLFPGVWMALNRLMRGARSSILRTLPVVRGPAGIKYLDPLP